MRVDGWPERLVAALDRIGGETFELGRSDCFTLVQDVVEAVTGSAPYPSERGAYRSERGARRRLRKAGFADMGAFLASLGPEIPPGLARRGDVGIAIVGGDASAVVCAGQFFGRHPVSGLVPLPLARVFRAWRIG